jgi:hypothetical protein
MSLHAPVTVPPNYSTTALPPHPHRHAHSQAQEESPSLRYTSLYIGATGGVREKMTQGQMGDLELDQMRTGFERAFASDGASDFMATVKFEGRSSPLICLPLSLPLPATRNAMPFLASPCHAIPYHTIPLEVHHVRRPTLVHGSPPHPVVLSGAQEATWEHEAAEIIWDESHKFFPAAAAAADAAGELAPHVGLFSGGGKSMQLARRGSALSFPFSTFPAELEERQGAAPDAWLDPAKWDRFAEELLAKVKASAAEHELFDGCFVGTAMNHRAARYTEIDEQPITAGEAVAALRASLRQFRAQEGALYERMMRDHRPGSSYPLARITAMHTFRLATVLENLFSPDACFFFAKNGTDCTGHPIDCEWTVGDGLRPQPRSRPLSSSPPPPTTTTTSPPPTTTTTSSPSSSSQVGAFAELARGLCH